MSSSKPYNREFRLSEIAQRITSGIDHFAEADWFSPLRVTLPSLSLRVGTAICFDGVFPEVSRDFVRAGATLLAYITNDAWYGI